MKCDCGLEANFHEFTSFSYWYCPACKKEVSSPLEPPRKVHHEARRGPPIIIINQKVQDLFPPYGSPNPAERQNSGDDDDNDRADGIMIF